MDSQKYKEELLLLDDMHEIYSMLHSISNRIQTEVDAGLKGITSRQLMLLVALRHLDENEATIVNIAALLGSSKQNVTRLVSGMIKSGYLTSSQGESDKRCVNISITEKGLSVMNENTVKSNMYFLSLFKGYSKDELKLLRSLLTKLDKPNERKLNIKQNAEIDIGKNSEIIDSFLEKLHENFLK